MVPTSLTIDDFPPLPLRRPASIAELCGLVKEAAASGQGIYPVGGRTTLDVGLPPSKPGFAVDTTALADVIDYPARDMTITVQAGLPIARLQETLAAEGQWLPVDVAQPDRATLGGAVALNKSGPHRLGYGTLRDYVIGISFVTDEGQEVKAGGRVVKNVAGYDLMKLQVGAAGTLGVMTKLTLKVKPKPEASAVVSFGCDTAALGPVLDVLHASPSRPAAVELLNAAAWQGADFSPPIDCDWILVVGLEEKASTVKWQTATLLEELRSAPVRQVGQIEGTDCSALWHSLTDLQLRAESQWIAKANVLPSKVAEVLRAIPDSARCLMHAEPLNGIIWIHSREGLSLEPQILAEGNFQLRRCPTAEKRRLPVWGRPGGATELMQHVKRTLDPQDIFNPGRLFDISRQDGRNGL